MDQSHLSDCLTEIESRLGWGPSSQWTNQDFELLEEEIFEKTGTRLSLTTLKRIWGKVDYQSAPSNSTLNILAQYLGFGHWRDFQTQYRTPSVDPDPAVPPVRQAKGGIRQWVAIVFILLVALVSVFFFIDKERVFFKSEEVVFRSKTVTTGLPNTVIFEYDVSSVIADSFHIQQSWDKRRRKRVSAEDKSHTSFYYYPGFFHAKLVANDKVMKEHGVLVETDGWLTLVERFPEPIYINNLMHTDAGVMDIDIDHFKQRDDHLQDKDFWTSYYYVKDFGKVDAKNIEFSVRIKNASDLGSICHESRVALMCTNGHISIPLSAPGCVSQLNMMLGYNFLSGKKNDFSALGCDLSDWIDLRVKTTGQQYEIYINDLQVMTQPIQTDPGVVIGLKLMFNGVGQVDDVQIKTPESVLFAEDFGGAI